MIAAIGVVVPAHNEEQTIGPCLSALADALRGIRLPTRVCVVADRCTDATVPLVRAVLPEAMIHVVDDNLPLGSLRDLGMRAVLGDHHPADVWLLGTDADTRVCPDWVRNQLAHAEAGADAVTGLVDLLDAAHLTASLRTRYAEIVSAGLLPESHNHVHGANFGVRASAFLAVGGYRPLHTGEDRDLWFRLLDAGYCLRQPLDLHVRTSSRLVGRARGGLADMLATLAANPTATTTATATTAVSGKPVVGGGGSA